MGRLKSNPCNPLLVVILSSHFILALLARILARLGTLSLSSSPLDEDMTPQTLMPVPRVVVALSVDVLAAVEATHGFCKVAPSPFALTRINMVSALTLRKTIKPFVSVRLKRKIHA